MSVEYMLYVLLKDQSTLYKQNNWGSQTFHANETITAAWVQLNVQYTSVEPVFKTVPERQLS